MKIKCGMVLNKVGEKYVAVPTGEALKDSNSLVRLNETAYYVWTGIEKGLNIDEITDSIVKDFEGVTFDEVKCDVTATIDYLAEKGFVSR